jgi:hypothetical protein
MSWDVMADAGFLCNKDAVLMDRIKGTFCTQRFMIRGEQTVR